MADHHQLRELLGSDGPTVQRFLDLLGEQIPRLAHELRAAAHRHDWPTVAIHAHNLKSNLRYLGAETAAELAYQVEQNAENEVNTTELPALAGQLAEAAVAALG